MIEHFVVVSCCVCVFFSVKFYIITFIKASAELSHSKFFFWFNHTNHFFSIFFNCIERKVNKQKIITYSQTIHSRYVDNIRLLCLLRNQLAWGFVAADELLIQKKQRHREFINNLMYLIFNQSKSICIWIRMECVKCIDYQLIEKQKEKTKLWNWMKKLTVFYM